MDIIKTNPSKKWRFKPNFYLSLITLLLIALFVYLGFWQLHRSKEKQDLLSQYEQNIHMPLSESESQLLLQNHGKENIQRHLRFKHLTLQGEFLNDYFILLDNQILNNKVGFQVYSLFKTQNSDNFILVDRGFIASSPNGRKSLSSPPLTELKIPCLKKDDYVISTKISGTIIFPSKGIQLKEDSLIERQKNDLILIQQIDYSKLSHFLKLPLENFVFKLDKDSAFTLLYTPIHFGLTATKHLAYALQWFTMALAIFLYFCYITIAKKYI